MKNENKELLNNDVEINVSEEEIVLAPPVELFDEAKEIAQSTLSDEKFPFSLQCDSNQKEFLLSILETVGAIVEDDDDDGHILATMMNMTQLAFIKRLNCIEGVKHETLHNPFLFDNPNKPIAKPISISAQAKVIGETFENKNVSESNVAAATVTASPRSSCGSDSHCSSCSSCTCNKCMSDAKEILDESRTNGCIRCPETEQWFKFTATKSKEYTIMTTGSADTVGILYDCCGNEIARNDDNGFNGTFNFKIVHYLTAGCTYYVKVRLYGYATGSYTLFVTPKIYANYVNINKSTITLEKGVTYELPITPNYTYKGYNGAQRIPGLSVSISPSNANEQKIWWWEQYGSILECSYGWDEDGDRYIHVTATEIGTAKLYAQDWNENGKTDECTVVVNSREQITVKRDGVFNKIVFENSGKTWYSLNLDYINDWNTLSNNDLKTIRDRLYRSTYTTVNWDYGWAEVGGVKLYSKKEMKLLYLLDPLGFASYVQEYAKYVYSDLSDMVDFKDSVFTTLFGRTPKYYARNTDGNWYDATSQKNMLSIHKILSESELLFGTHPIYDYTTVREIFATVIQILTLPVSLASLAHVQVPIAYKTFLKCMNLKFSIWQANVENDFKKYVEAIRTATESVSETKSADYDLDWAKQLFKLSDNFGALAEALADKPSFYREIFDLCANNEDYRIVFEYNNGTIEDVSSISNKLN